MSRKDGFVIKTKVVTQYWKIDVEIVQNMIFENFVSILLQTYLP